MGKVFLQQEKLKAFGELKRKRMFFINVASQDSSLRRKSSRTTGCVLWGAVSRAVSRHKESTQGHADLEDVT